MAVGNLKARLRAKFTRRNSTSPTISSDAGEVQQAHSRARSVSSIASHATRKTTSTIGSATLEEGKEEVRSSAAQPSATQESSAFELELHVDDPQLHTPTSTKDLDVAVISKHNYIPTAPDIPTLITDNHIAGDLQERHGGSDQNGGINCQSDIPEPSPIQRQTSCPKPTGLIFLQGQQTASAPCIPESEITPSDVSNLDDFINKDLSHIPHKMGIRKIWVKRPNASATLVTINDDDLVDDVREMILKKYANSLGRNFDAPDVTLRICPREPRQERTLGPEEPMTRTLDAYFPGSQTVEEALIIDVPLRRTPKPSPRGGPPVGYYQEELRPGETGSDYFPPMPVPIIPSPRLPNSVLASTISGPTSGGHHPNNASHAISVLTTGHVPNLPSPGGSRRHYPRPRAVRQHTSSPTVLNGHVQTPSTAINNGTHNQSRVSRSRTHSSASEKSIAPPAPPLPTPPAQEVSQIQRTSTPPPRVSSPRVGNRPKRSKKNSEHPSLPAGLLNGAVPPINVLIVEDNIINLKLLEAFMKRLKVRWQTAMNGKEAVTKWRTGGFHLVLMDIQLPVMNGLEATREIRRLEKLNSIGVFSSSASSSAPERADEPEGDDKLPSSILFKSPVIIVALTASSLQSDRHEALAAGCNDFLTKPVNFVWLERKVMEWGCMQALIDFDGWRKWKDFSQNNTESESSKKIAAPNKSKAKKNRMSLGSSPGVSIPVNKSIKEEAEEIKV